MSASKAVSSKVSASLQSGDSKSLLQTALFVGVAVLVVLLLIFLYKKFVAKKHHNEYFEGTTPEDEYERANGHAAEHAEQPQSPSNEEEFAGLFHHTPQTTHHTPQHTTHMAHRAEDEEEFTHHNTKDEEEFGAFSYSRGRR